MKKTIIDTCVIISSFLAASVSYFGIPQNFRIGKVKIFFIIFLVLILLLLILTWSFYFYKKPKTYKNTKKEKINKYLENLYKKTGHCYIFSKGSMTWFNYGTIKESLLKKCKEHQLTIVVPQENESTGILKHAGGFVFTNDDLNIKNFASWSITNPEGSDCLIAIGNDVRNRHTIKEYTIQDMDFINISRLVTKLLDLLSKQNGDSN